MTRGKGLYGEGRGVMRNAIDSRVGFGLTTFINCPRCLASDRSDSNTLLESKNLSLDRWYST